ncbi:hypothetical protein DXG01_009305 [Tephrocybe rancida]|nr:hypothetical protein DXG01_009305 [Tephrocybe rancida]
MPESPRFLVKIGRLDEVKALLIRLRAPSSPSPSFKDEKPQENDENKAAIAEHTSILDAVQLERKHAGMNSYWNMFWETDNNVGNLGSRLDPVLTQEITLISD